MNNNIPLNIRKSIEELIEETKKMFNNHLKKIILYGSYARGDYNSSSDIDIMILTDLTDAEIIEDREKVWDIAYDMEWDNNFDITISPLVKNIDKFNYWLEALPFYMNVQREGVVLSESKNI